MLWLVSDQPDSGGWPHVYRSIEIPHREPDYKAFTQRKGAQSRFRAGSLRVSDGDLEEAAMFEVAADNPRAAIDAVITGKGGKVTLIDIDPEPMTREQAIRWLANIGL